MRYLKTSVVMTVALLLALTLRLHGQAPQRDWLVWAPVPSTPNGWVAPNKPHTKLADLLAAHKGQASWREPIVRDALLRADYVQMAPGTKTPRQFQPDSPIWWVVQSGEVRFTIEGQERSSPTKVSSFRSRTATSTSSRPWAPRPRCFSK